MWNIFEVKIKTLFSCVSMVDFEQGYISWVYTKNTKEKFIYFNPSRLDPGQKEKNNLNFYFHTSLWCLKRIYEGLKGLHKTF